MQFLISVLLLPVKIAIVGFYFLIILGFISTVAVIIGAIGIGFRGK